VTSVLVCLLSAQGQTQSPSSLSPAGSSQSAANPNPGSETAAPAAKNSTSPQTAEAVGAQIDELIKRANEAINIKVQFQRAEELARQALDLSEKAGDKVRAANAMIYLSAALGYQGRLAESLEVAQKNVPVARESGDKKVLEQALNSLASITGGMGRYEEALGIFYECLDLAREINDPTMQYMSLLNIGEAYVRSDDPDKAELPLQQSLRIARELKPNLRASNPSKKATEMALLNLGGMEMARQHYRAALNYYEQVHVSKPESSLWVVAALQGMAASYEQLGEPQKAIEFLDEAIPIAEKAASGVEYRNLLSALGVDQEKLGNLDAALASENKALELMHEAGGDPDSEWQVESRIAHIERALGDNDQALEHYQKSISGIELLRSVALNTEEGRAGLVERSRATYTETADLLVDLHRQNEALEMAERCRARAFLDMLAETRIGVADELTPDQHKREDEILTHISGTQKKLWNQNVSSDERKKNEAELNAAEADLEKLHLQIRETNPHYASLQYPEPIRVQQIQSKLLDDRTALVEYLLGEKRSLVWVVSRGKVTTAILPARKDIEERVAAYRKLLGERVSVLTLEQSLTRINVLGGELHDLLFKPIEKDVRACKTLIIVPDGTLGYLPFESLVTASSHTRNTFLAEKFAVVYGPSASALVTVEEMNRQVMSHRELLAFGDPVITPENGLPKIASEQSSDSIAKVRSASLAEDYAERGFSLARLPYTRDEVMGIGRLFPPDQRQLYLGADAREEKVKNEELDDFRYIHFATHGFLDELHPGRSGIILSRAPDSKEDGILQTGEIMRLKLNADIVTLSACSTGLGKLVNGEGVLGLTRAFFYAGARNVVVSLWNVNDSATATLMQSFYLNLRRGLSKNEALRQAKLSLLRSSQRSWHHPYFWAAFVMQGQGH
jgi:CHAT domain-containing protein/tetratricopeptide (TPR) repeat protein